MSSGTVVTSALARWQETRSPLLADLLCAVAPDPAWTARLAAANKGLPSAAIRGVEALPDDPRTTVFLVEALRTARWSGTDSRTLWTLVLERLVALRDARCVPLLRALAATPPRFFQLKFTRWIAAEIAVVAERLAEVVSVPDDRRTLALAKQLTVEPPVAGFFAVPRTADVDALLARVWAAPNDVDLRAVVGVALLVAGEPRGELIALQRDRKRNGKAIEKLVEEHGEALAGPIGRILPHPLSTSTALKFDAGFLAACTVGTHYATARDWNEAAVAQHWATVIDLAFWDGARVPKRTWLASWWKTAPLASLRTITANGVTLARSAADAPWQLRRVPDTLRAIELEELERLFATMPRDELARIVVPAGEHPLGTLLRSLGGKRNKRSR